MARPLLPDGLWAEIAPLLPPEPAKPKGGRPRTCDRAALTGILFVLRSGTPWELLPRDQHRIARRGIESSQRLGRHRWVVERTLAWFAQFRRLAIRYERRADIHLAFSTLATLIVWRFIKRWFCWTL